MDEFGVRIRRRRYNTDSSFFRAPRLNLLDPAHRVSEVDESNLSVSSVATPSRGPSSREVVLSSHMSSAASATSSSGASFTTRPNVRTLQHVYNNVAYD